MLMTEEIIATKVKNFIEDVSGERPTLEQNFRGDLKMDSLDKVEAIMLVEKEFSIDIEDDEFDDLQTVNQLVDIVNKKVNER